MNCVSSSAKLGLRNRIMNEVHDNEEMIGMEKKILRCKASGYRNESDADHDFKTARNVNFRGLMICLYPHMDIRYFRGRGGIVPR